MLLGLGLYVHVFAALTVLPHAVWIVMRRPPRRHVAVGAGLAMVVGSPIVIYFLYYSRGPANRLDSSADSRVSVARGDPADGRI